MKILIIRHGEPDYSIDSLTEKGWREAELLAKRMEKIPAEAYYVSPLGRAKDTAAPTLRRVGREAQVLPWLAEFRGRFISPTKGEDRIPWNLSPQYWTRQPDLYDREAWRDHALYRAGNVNEIYDETIEGLDALLRQYGYERCGALYRCKENTDRTIVLFCHFGIGMVMLSHLLGISPVVMWQCFFMPASSVTTLVTEERIQGEVFFKAMQVGDTSHLYAGNESVSNAGLYHEVNATGEILEAQ
ncbi:MAG: histidine phosphatase family protein [Clostridia bacterium]|nr:histidine phosphatase family protein [Clostridia bacterium]